LPPQLQLAPSLLGVDEPPATLCANVEMRRFTLWLLQRGQATLSALLELRTNFSNDTPQLAQSYSKIGMTCLRCERMQSKMTFTQSNEETKKNKDSFAAFVASFLCARPS
jgi:hypothetical protein